MEEMQRGFHLLQKGIVREMFGTGDIKAGDTVHHKIHLTPKNINDPNITLNWDNLMLLCRDCHAEVHSRAKRYTVDKDGRVHANQ